ncbi:MAG: hypothetical protein WAS25_02970 [Geothrix sp.]|uniref:hypothetical protein n=1 Tax=Geothrix sp. TaxID=1962974 RepID=UPI003BB207E4
MLIEARALWLSVVLSQVLAGTGVPWPKERPVQPVSYAAKEALVQVGQEGIPKAIEVAADWKKFDKSANALRGLSALPEFPEIKRTWDRGEIGKAAGMLSWTLLKVGFPPADAVDLAGKAMAAGILAGKDAAHRNQLNDLYRSYKAAGSGGAGGDRGVYGFRQGFLSGNIREDIRRTCPGVTEENLRRMEETALRTYCENRQYQEGFEAYKQQVKRWMSDNGIPWSGEEATFERLLIQIDGAEKQIAARGASGSLFDLQRAKLIRAILRGGPTGLDTALAEFFSQHFGDVRNAKGEKVGTRSAAPTPAPTRPTATYRNVFEWAVPPDRRWQLGDWQVKHGSAWYQTGELYVNGESIGAWNLTDGGEATRIRQKVLDVPPNTRVELKVTIPKAGPSYTMTISQTTGARDATFKVWWFCDSLFCEPKK